MEMSLRMYLHLRSLLIYAIQLYSDLYNILLSDWILKLVEIERFLVT